MSAEPERDPSIPKAFEVVGEHYRLLKKLGEGAFGVVYEACHDLLGQNFAVKILKPELCEDENLRERFLDEARALIRFSHENVVQLRHVGEHAGRLYLVMDLVEGLSLSDVIRRDGALGEERAVSFILQVLHGLEAAHAAGIVHRDLKPGNLIVDVKPDGGERVRILDFGLSKLSSVDGMQSAHRSATGAIIGTLAYMSPEQLSGEKAIDARSDVFATGLILHEMLDGRHPFPGESGIVVAAKLLREAVPDLEEKKGSKLSDATRAALRTSLERDRDARFPSAFTFAQALEGKGPPSDTSRVTTIQEAKAALAVAEAARKEKARATATGRRKSTTILVAVVAAVAAAAGIFFAMQDGDGEGTDVAKRPGRENPTLPAPADPGPSAETPPTTPPADPGPVEPPGPVDPAPTAVPPDPVPPDPVPPDPVDPEPIVPPPVDPEPIVAPPVDPEPVEPADPGPVAVDTPGPETPTPPIEPADLTRDAQALQEKGKWDEAHGAWRQTLAADPMSVEALRGAAMTLLAKADAEARRGAVNQALETLDGVIAFLTKQNVDVYRPAIQTSREKAQRPMGFVHTHRGEAHAARARWLRVKGDAAAEKHELAEAEADLKLAWQYLERDGVHYWDFLLRRADFHRLNGDQRKAIDDLALTTQIASDLVPTRMWVAHFSGLRRAAEQMLRGRKGRGGRGPGRNPRRPAAGGNAAKLAEDARRLVRSGETWARTREEPFTREEWLEAARVIVVSDIAAPATEDRNAFKGLLGWYLEQARLQPRPAWESAEEAEARLRPLEAEYAVLEAKAAMKARNMDQARQFSGQALAKAREGVRLAEKVAAAGGPLPDALPYAMLAYVLQAQGQEEPARKALERAREAGLRNPD